MLGYVAIGLALAAGGVPASLAQDPRVLERCNSPATEAEAERQTPVAAASNRGVSVEVPIGRVCVGPEFLDGAPIYVRRTTVSQGTTIVEVSTTPFMPEAASGVVALNVRPDQPASW